MSSVKRLNVVVACARNSVIGKDGSIPWDIPEDHAFFEGLCRGGVCIIGRRTLHAWPGACRDGRRAIVLTSRPLPTIAGSGISVLAAPANDVPPQAASSFDAALTIADALPGDIFVLGGQRVYEAALRPDGFGGRPVRLFLTRIDCDIPGGDAFFPPWEHLGWTAVCPPRRSSGNGYSYEFLVLDRVFPSSAEAQPRL